MSTLFMGCEEKIIHMETDVALFIQYSLDAYHTNNQEVLKSFQDYFVSHVKKIYQNNSDIVDYLIKKGINCNARR